jgi:hypothetical protein
LLKKRGDCLRKGEFLGEEEFIEKRGYFICYLGILLRKVGILLVIWLFC